MFSFFRDFDRSFFPMTQTSSFSALGISPEILEAIEVLGFDTPSSIQEQAIPAATGGAGKDEGVAVGVFVTVDLSNQATNEIKSGDYSPVSLRFQKRRTGVGCGFRRKAHID